MIKHLHLSHSKNLEQTSSLPLKSDVSPEIETSEKAPIRVGNTTNVFSIQERLYTNFTETCPLFLLKDGIDHRFEFLDFAPDLYIRHLFHPIDQDDSRINPKETQTEMLHAANASNTHLFFTTIHSNIERTTEFE